LASESNIKAQESKEKTLQANHVNAVLRVSNFNILIKSQMTKKKSMIHNQRGKIQSQYRPRILMHVDSLRDLTIITEIMLNENSHVVCLVTLSLEKLNIKVT